MIKYINYFIIFLVLASCTEVIPEITPVDNNPAKSDKIYLSEGQNPSSVNVSNDGSIWASSHECYYKLNNNKVTKYPIGWTNWGLPFGLYKSGVYFVSTLDDTTSLFTNILNNKVSYYEFPEELTNSEGHNWLELDSLMCLGLGDPNELYYFFNGKEWKSHAMQNIPVGKGINNRSRYNSIFKWNDSTDYVVYNALSDKEVSFEYVVPANKPFIISEHSLAKNGDVFGIQNNKSQGNSLSLVTFNFDSEIIKTSKITLSTNNLLHFNSWLSNITYTDLFLDMNEQLWTLGTYLDSLNNQYNFVYKLNTPEIFLINIPLGLNKATKLFVDGNGIIWIYVLENSGNYTIYRYENKVLKDTRTVSGNQLAFVKEDNDNNFWFGAWSQTPPYAIDMFCFKNGDYETFEQYFMH